MFNLFTDPPKALLQALEDIGAIADVARRVPELEAQLEGIVEQVSNDLSAVRGGLERLEVQVGAMSGKLDDLKEEMSPIGQLPAMREAVEPLDGRMLELKATVEPIAQLPAMREAVEPLDGRMQVMTEKLDGLREEMHPIQELPEVRKEIAPLGAKMDVLTHITDDIEPMLRQVTDAIHELVPKIEEVRDSVAPVGDVIDNLPKFMKN